jgi:hypothetical protein
MWKRCRRHLGFSLKPFVNRLLHAEQRFDAAVEQARIDTGFHAIEHAVHEVDQRVGRGHRAIDAPVRKRIEDRDMIVDGA